jgi:ABC-type phosphate transport system substrate-binding protein
MKAVGVLILLVTVASSSVLPDSPAPRQSPPTHTPRVAWEGLAIVVNRDNPTNDISLPQLRSMFFGERRWWSSKRRITLAAMRRNTPEWKTVQRVIYKVNRRELDHYYLYQSFKGEGSTPPATMQAPSDVKKFVVSTPGALGYLRASDVDDSVKVVRVNGLLPGDDGYPLRLQARPPKPFLRQEVPSR